MASACPACHYKTFRPEGTYDDDTGWLGFLLFGWVGFLLGMGEKKTGVWSCSRCGHREDRGTPA
jgi:hypothetical protein